MKLYKRKDGLPGIYVELEDIESLVPITDINNSVHTTKDDCTHISTKCKLVDSMIDQWFLKIHISHISRLSVLPIVKCIVEKGDLRIGGLHFVKGELHSPNTFFSIKLTNRQRSVLNKAKHISCWYTFDHGIDLKVSEGFTWFPNRYLLYNKLKAIYKDNSLLKSKYSGLPGFKEMPFNSIFGSIEGDKISTNILGTKESELAETDIKVANTMAKELLNYI